MTVWKLTNALVGVHLQQGFPDGDPNLLLSPGGWQHSHDPGHLELPGVSIPIQLDANSSLFLVPATTQMTFKIYNPKTKKLTWKSVNVSNFKTDGRSSKSDAFVRRLPVAHPR